MYTAGGVGRGVPGVVRDWWVPGGAIPVHYPAMLQDPYLVIFEARVLPTAK